MSGTIVPNFGCSEIMFSLNIHFEPYLLHLWNQQIYNMLCFPILLKLFYL